MQKEKIIEFFDTLAGGWDADCYKDEQIVEAILDNAEVTRDCSVLDVACGTGVMIENYKNRGIFDITAIDISGEMIKIASSKFSDVEFICGDVEEYAFGRKFDRIVVYNAFPHFPDPERLVAVLAGLLDEGGVLTVAHGMSREQINAHHNGKASSVSQPLLSAEELSSIFAKHLKVTCSIDNGHMYQVAGKKS